MDILYFVCGLNWLTRPAVPAAEKERKKKEKEKEDFYVFLFLFEANEVVL